MANQFKYQTSNFKTRPTFLLRCNKSSLRWYNNTNYKELYRQIKVKNKSYTKNDLINDQKIRGEDVAQIMCEDINRKLILLDGSVGRMLYQILDGIYLIKPKLINKAKIIVPEIDAKVHLEHLKNFPKSCSCVYEDIHVTIRKYHRQNPIVYANFCKIEGAKGIRKIGRIINDYGIQDFIVSFLNRGMPTLNNLIAKNFQNYTRTKLDRGNFVTFFMKRK
ncbi:MAG: hypothetical protein CMF62_02965 [Magnetococcales bacterium]|nr:hypothetical protein [Magnetococcales bacterium]|tara:strand:- start:5289 stop:5948 length:660 start_codon:yes stop_codon:yes gene_type:complete